MAETKLVPKDVVDRLLKSHEGKVAELQTALARIAELERELKDSKQELYGERQLWQTAVSLVLQHPEDLKLIGTSPIDRVRVVLKPVAELVSTLSQRDEQLRQVREAFTSICTMQAGDRTGEPCNCMCEFYEPPVKCITCTAQAALDLLSTPSAAQPEAQRQIRNV